MEIEDGEKTVTANPDSLEEKLVTPHEKGVPVKETDDTHEEPTDPASLRKQIGGLKAELSRRKGQADKVAVLESKIDELTQRLASNTVQPGKQVDAVSEAIDKLDDKALIDRQTDWEEELVESRISLSQAMDDTSKKEASDRVKWAKHVLGKIRVSLKDRVLSQMHQSINQRDNTAQIQNEVNTLFDTVSQRYPELADRQSELWKSAKDEYDTLPNTMRALGELGEIVAVAAAIGKNPALVTKNGNERKELLNELSTLSTRAPRGRTSADFTKGVNVESMSLPDFEKYIEKLKAGG